MNTSSSILRQYQVIASISGQMLTQARLNQWDAVISLGKQYQQAVRELRAMDPLSTGDRLARKDLLAKILSDDAHIRNLAAPELVRLGALLGNMKRQQTVLRAYDSSTSASS